MKSVVLILPYFGKFPDIFPLFLKTAEKNPNINFLIISDSEENINTDEGGKDVIVPVKYVTRNTYKYIYTPTKFK